MTDLQFEVLGVGAAAQAAPALVFQLGITDAAAARVQGIYLHAHVQIEPRVRRYSAEEQTRAFALFGPPADWHRTLRPLPWAQVSTVVPAFTGRIAIDLAVPCTYDLDVSASRYLHAMREGATAARLLFSGTIFVASERGYAVEQVPWDREAFCRVPAGLWTEIMDRHFPGCGWVRLRRETLDALLAFRDRQAVVSWDDTIDRLLLAARAQEEPS